MDYEKLHNDALEIGKKLIETNPELRDWVESKFSELKENEDEKIRKELISFITDRKNWFPKEETKASWIAWLEKQGKQEQLYIRFGEIPTDEKSNIYQGEIEVGTENGVSVYPAFKTDKGDIVLGLNLPITKTTLYTQQHLIEYDDRPCYLVKGDYVGKDTDGQPLINNISIIERIDSYRVKEEKQGEQKPAWSEEDERILNKIQDHLREFYVDKKGYPYVAKSDSPEMTEHNWLNSIKDRVRPQSKQEWSEEDEEILKGIIDNIQSRLECDPIEQLADIYSKEISWLKSLKERMKGE